MQAVPRHPLIDDYLDRLAAAAQPLGPRRAGELMDDIREHLTEALPGPDVDGADVRRVLDRLGEPHDVVAAAWDDDGMTARETVLPALRPDLSRGGEPWRFVTAVALLVAAQLLAPLWLVSVPMWIAGLILFATVTGWTARERALGWVFLGGGFPMGLLFTIAVALPFAMTSQVCTALPDGTQQCTGSTASDWGAAAILIVFALFFVGQIVTVVALVRARRRG